MRHEDQTYKEDIRVMKISKRPGEEFVALREGEQLSQVRHFNCLGSQMKTGTVRKTSDQE